MKNTENIEKTESTESTERNIDKLKAKNKELALAIRKARIEHKETQRGNRSGSSWKTEAKLKSLQRDFRHHHIAYCELRGRTRKQIEPKLRDDTPRPEGAYISRIKEEYAWSPEEIARYQERMAKREKAIHFDS